MIQRGGYDDGSWRESEEGLVVGDTPVERAGGFSPTLRALGGYPMAHILGETFYAQVSILYGPCPAAEKRLPFILRGPQDERCDH